MYTPLVQSIKTAVVPFFIEIQTVKVQLNATKLSCKLPEVKKMVRLLLTIPSVCLKVPGISGSDSRSAVLSAVTSMMFATIILSAANIFLFVLCT